MWRFWRPWIKNILFYLLPQGRQYNRVLKNLHAFSAKVVACRKKLLLNNQKAITDVTPDKKKRLSFMDLILEETENRQTINDTDLKALVDTFLFAVSTVLILIKLKSMSVISTNRVLKLQATP